MESDCFLLTNWKTANAKQVFKSSYILVHKDRAKIDEKSGLFSNVYSDLGRFFSLTPYSLRHFLRELCRHKPWSMD